MINSWNIYCIFPRCLYGMHTQLLCFVHLFATSCTVAYQALLSMGFPRQEYWSQLPFLLPGDLPDPGIEPESPELAGRFFTTESSGKIVYIVYKSKFVFFSALHALWCVHYLHWISVVSQSLSHPLEACASSGKYVFITTSPLGLILNHPSLLSVSFFDCSWNILLWVLRRKWQCSEALEKNNKIESEKREEIRRREGGPFPSSKANVYIYSSVQFSCSVVCDSLRPHELRHARPPCLSPSPGVHSNSCPSSLWCHPAISSFVVPFSSCPQSLPASESFPMSQLFAWGGQSTWVSALASFLPKNTQGWSPSEWTCWISLQSKGLSRVFSNTTVQKHQFFGAQLSSQSNSCIHTWPLEKPQLPAKEISGVAFGLLFSPLIC